MARWPMCWQEDPRHPCQWADPPAPSWHVSWELSLGASTLSSPSSWVVSWKPLPFLTRLISATTTRSRAHDNEAPRCFFLGLFSAAVPWQREVSGHSARGGVWTWMPHTTRWDPPHSAQQASARAFSCRKSPLAAVLHHCRPCDLVAPDTGYSELLVVGELGMSGSFFE